MKLPSDLHFRKIARRPVIRGTLGLSGYGCKQHAGPRGIRCALPSICRIPDRSAAPRATPSRRTSISGGNPQALNRGGALLSSAGGAYKLDMTRWKAGVLGLIL